MFSVQIYYTFSKLGAAAAQGKGKIKNKGLGETRGKGEQGLALRL